MKHRGWFVAMENIDVLLRMERAEKENDEQTQVIKKCRAQVR